ncbi:MAG: hypothetical protein VX777_09820 [Chlamydiota bacterium]|nr:hypothetical protein [Chlamydiota bacterium]
MSFSYDLHQIDDSINHWMQAAPIFVLSGISGLYALVKATEKVYAQMQLSRAKKKLGDQSLLPIRKFDVDFGGSKSEVNRLQRKVDRLISWKELGKLTVVPFGSLCLGFCAGLFINT